jgi:TolB protein
MVLSKDGNPEIYVLDLETRKLDRITQHYAIDTEPDWFPDGKALIFTSDRGGRAQIYKVPLASKRPERITYEGEYNARGRLTPDGKTLIMVHRTGGKVFNIATQNLATGEVRKLTETTLDESPTVAPNGRMLMYATRYKDKGILAAVSIDGGIRVTLPASEGDVREPAWSPLDTRFQ